MKVNSKSLLSIASGFGLSLGVVSAQPTPRLASEVMNRRIVNDRVVYYADELKLNDSDVLVVEEPATIFTNKLEMDRNSVIDTSGNDLDVIVGEEADVDGGMIDGSFEQTHDTSGEDGQDGVHGMKAADALKGAAGADGGHASDGSDGADGAAVSIITPVLKGNLTIITRGGNGGTGGNGGDGGRGGEGFSGSDARTLYYFRGLSNLGLDQLLNIGTMIGVPYVGQVLAILSIFNGIRIGDGFDGFDGGKGGRGGSAGRGGNGGLGGDIELIFGRQIKGTKILVNARGGRAGVAGRPGVGGGGGAGGLGGQRGDIWAREGKPGKSGLPGEMGATATAGAAGKGGKVKAIETGDEDWVRCYVRYRQILELDNDRDLAREVLRSCT